MIRTEFIDLSTVRFTPELLRRIPAQLARKYRVLPFAEYESRFKIVMADPSDLIAIEDISTALAKDIEVCTADPTRIDALIKCFYSSDNPS